MSHNLCHSHLRGRAIRHSMRSLHEDANALRVETSLRSPRKLTMRRSTDSTDIASCKRIASRRGEAAAIMQVKL